MADARPNSPNRPDRQHTRVRDVMTPSPRTVDGLTSVHEAIALMRDTGVSALVIDRRHDDDEYGMVSVQDIAAQVIAEDRPPERISVYEIMSKPVLTVGVDMDVRHAIRLLARVRLSRALVVEDGEMVGIVTLRDLAIRGKQAH